MLDQFRVGDESKIAIRKSEIQMPVWLSSDSSSFVNCRGSPPRECVSLRRPHFASRARVDEQRAFNPRVQGASPWRCTNSKAGIMRFPPATPTKILNEHKPIWKLHTPNVVPD